jgi:NitT/TauT family transport system substrate-binding protein
MKKTFAKLCLFFRLHTVIKGSTMKTKSLLLLALLLAACTAAPTAEPTVAPATLPATVAGATARPAAALRTIRLPMGYLPSVQFAPFYVAKEKGYFAAEGLDVVFDYAFETDGVALVGAGELPFAIVSAEQVLLARAQQLPVVYVMAWFQKFPVAIMARAEAGLDTPAALRGKRIGTPLLGGANFVGLHALLSAASIPPEDVTIEAIGFNQMPALEAGQVDAVVVYSNNEPIRLAAQGQSYSVLAVSDYATLAANGLLTNEATVANEPELVRAFVRAVLRGLADTNANLDEAYTITTHFVEGLTDPALEKQVLAATMALWQADRPGYSDPAAWDNMQATLIESGLLTEAQDVGKAFTNEFVP